MRAPIALALAASLVASACSSPSSYWSEELRNGPYADYLDNNHGWTDREELDTLPGPNGTGWKIRSRQVVATDRLPGLDADEVLAAVGQNLRGIGKFGDYIVPPMFRVLHMVDSDHAVVITNGIPSNPGRLEFLVLSTGEREPLELDGEPLLDWNLIHTFGLGDEPSSDGEDRSVWLLAPHPDQSDRQHLVVTDPFGKLLYARRSLRLPDDDRDGLLSHGGMVFVATRDETGKEVTLLLDQQGHPHDMILPPVQSFERVQTGEEWWDESDSPITPASETELAIAIGELEQLLPDDAAQLEDSTLYLPIGSDGLPLPLPANALGMLRLVSYTEREDSPLYVNMGQDYGNVTRYPDCHSGWILVTQEADGIVLQPSSGTAERVLAAAIRDALPRFANLWPVSAQQLTYSYRGQDATGRDRHYLVTLPARAVGQLTDGRYQAIDLNLGCIQAMAFGDDTRGSLENMEIGLSNTDAFLFNTVTGRAMNDYDAFQEVQAQYARELAAAQRLAAEARAAEEERIAKLTRAEYDRTLDDFNRVLEAANWPGEVSDFLDNLEYQHNAYDRDYFYKFGANTWADLEWASAVGMSDSWVKERAEQLWNNDQAELARQAQILPLSDDPVGFSWDAVFDQWHINFQRNLGKSKTKVFTDRDKVRIVTYY